MQVCVFCLIGIAQSVVAVVAEFMVMLSHRKAHFVLYVPHISGRCDLTIPQRTMHLILFKS